jgi:hypothetical protein
MGSTPTVYVGPGVHQHPPQRTGNPPGEIQRTLNTHVQDTVQWQQQWQLQQQQQWVQTNAMLKQQHDQQLAYWQSQGYNPRP